MKDNKERKEFTAKTLRGDKVHVWQQPFGYPINICNWEMPSTDIDTTTINAPITCSTCIKIVKGLKRVALHGYYQPT